jgi:UDP-N-acetylmuramoylalanine--D-glutamate ligase
VSYFGYSNLPSQLIGKHNQANIAAALKVAEILQLDPNLSKQAVASFKGLPFRLERVGEKRGVVFINDTTSTTPIATITAIKALPQNLVLILGGSDKGLPFADLTKLICQADKVKKVVILGSFNNQTFVQALKDQCPQKILAQVKTMAEAVQSALTVAQPGEAILLSPGFASFDLFKNEFDRGRQFNEIIRHL